MNTFVHKDGQQYGPYADSDLITYLQNGNFSPADLAWREGMAQWLPLSVLYPQFAAPVPVIARAQPQYVAQAQAPRYAQPTPYAAPRAAQAGGATPYYAAGAQKKEVKGSLLFFCVALTILSPAFSVYQYVHGYREAAIAFRMFPRLHTMVIIDGVLSAVIVAMSIRAGIALWKIKPFAVQTTKRYLWCLLGYAIISAILPFTAGLPAAANKAMQPEVAKQCSKLIFFVIFWYSYLNRSKQVKETYNT